MDAKARQLYDDLVAKVNRVLYDEWAPIGFVGALPGDEYETYAVRVVSMLARGASEDDLAKYLTSIAAGFGMGFEAPSRTVAANIMDFKDQCRGLAP